jgi:hypothetical protein
MNVEAKDRVDFQRVAYRNSLKDVEIVRDAMAGTSRLREETTKYLPRHPAEEITNYRIRLKLATYLGAVSRTVSGLAGMVFQTDPVLGPDVPDPVKEHAENIDLGGAHLDVFLQSTFEDALVAGHSFIMVDYPTVEGPITLAEERERALRPYWVNVPKERVINWHAATEDGRTVLRDVVIREDMLKRDGVYGEKVEERYRVFRRENVAAEGEEPRTAVRWELWRPEKDTEPRTAGGEGDRKFELIAGGTFGNITEIPLVPIYTRRTGFFQSTPPLLDLANIAIAHWQLRADYRHALHMHCTPLLIVKGVEAEGDVEIGPNTVIKLPQEGEAKYIEPSGTATGAVRQELTDMRGDMASLGLALLSPEKRAAETAEAKKIDRAQSDSALTVAARSLQDAVELALQFHAQHMGLEDGGSITVNRDFQSRVLDANQINAYRELVAAGQMSYSTLWSVLERGGALPDGFDAVVEEARLDSEMRMFAARSDAA